MHAPTRGNGAANFFWRAAPGLFKLAGIEAEFSELLGGRRVDLRTAADLSTRFRSEVVNTADEQYAA